MHYEVVSALDRALHNHLRYLNGFYILNLNNITDLCTCQDQVLLQCR